MKNDEWLRQNRSLLRKTNEKRRMMTGFGKTEAYGKKNKK
jgi:hypothetical protein